jgi:hypothetical protein
MNSVKEKVIEWIRSLPDDCTLDDIRHHLYFREQVEEGLRALEEGRVIPHEEVERRMSEWLKSSGQSQR